VVVVGVGLGFAFAFFCWAWLTLLARAKSFAIRHIKEEAAVRRVGRPLSHLSSKGEMVGYSRGRAEGEKEDTTDFLGELIGTLHPSSADYSRKEEDEDEKDEKEDEGVEGGQKWGRKDKQ